jgi:hypothetical protein
VYERWWSMTEQCSGLAGSLEAVSFYAVPGVQFLDAGEAGEALGYWSRAGNRIVLVSRDTLDGVGVRHEMLHALARVAGHPRQSFLGRCAGVVDCGPDCISDAGPPPPPDPLAVEVPPDSIQVSTVIVYQPTGNTADDVITLAVRAHNPTAHPVIVTMPPLGTRGERSGYDYEVWGTSGGLQSGYNVLDPSSWTFAPGETKQQLFDFVNADFGVAALPPGTYQIRGAYGGHWSPYISVTR